MDVGLVCDACSALTPIGVPQCARCGQPVALETRAPRAKAAANNGATAGGPCGKCGTIVGPNNKFCPSCGTPFKPLSTDFTSDIQTRVTGSPMAKGRTNAPSYGGAAQTSRVKLTLIRGDGEDGVSFTLAGVDHLAGRGDCPISFPDDHFLSPVHANFRYANHQLVVRDEGSLNGVYVRITGTIVVETGTTVLVGEQVLSVHAVRPPEDVPDTEGTYYSASMLRPATFEIVQQLRGGASGWVFRPDAAMVTIGREANDINFPDDPFISGRHAQLQLAGGVLSVTDLGSRNGTFVRVTGDHLLKHGDYVFLGQQLLRVEIV